jgi:hypothetical protein
MWKPNSVLTLNTETKEWTKTRFDTFHQWKVFVSQQWKYPGEYNIWQNKTKRRIRRW